MEMGDSSGHHIAEQVLLKRIKAMQIQREPETPPLTKAEIVEDVSSAIPKEYINRYGNDIRSDERLRFRNRLHQRHRSGVFGMPRQILAAVVLSFFDHRAACMSDHPRMTLFSVTIAYPVRTISITTRTGILTDP